ncbi:hypothetical protein PROPHIT462_40 [Mycobacterium phage prophiT46-2]|uniref:hypothetical protein n=1 Tax=Mycobacteroides abscessus TaxID=36809 RepID=UPI00232ED924|nr:hypothetical protein [Mycobacteroides abscessus]MDB2219081.1 hypothetical protein [Mycobacteroides abscessus subsp. abscessus]WJJ56234.1 hypothetical protein PROPHIT462_40 [Mycobacterium phage prophiT46-2]
MLTVAQRALFGVGLLVGAALGIPAGTVMAASVSAELLTACAEEDGNPDGQPCTWTDPDTGRAFFVDSANYRG